MKANLPALQKKLSFLLRPFGAAYGLAMRARADAYAGGLLRSSKSQTICFSVGNIAWGGSGKTPLCSRLLDWAEERGLKAVVLSRGYGGNPPAAPFAVRPDSDPAQSGDEPLMLARKHPQAVVLVDPLRSRALSWAERNLEPDLILLDDGMQHLAVRRDVDLVLLRPEDLATDWGRVIPAGPWREGPTALKRADAFLLHADAALFGTLAPLAEERLAGYGKPLFSFFLKPLGLARVGAGGAPLLPGLDDADYLLCCGVGAPERVLKSAAELLGRQPVITRFFPDHHAYSQGDWETLRKHGLPMVCTAKDAAKLVKFMGGAPDAPLYSLEAGVEFGQGLFGGADFLAWLDKCVVNYNSNCNLKL